MVLGSILLPPHPVSVSNKFPDTQPIGSRGRLSRVIFIFIHLSHRHLRSVRFSGSSEYFFSPGFIFPASLLSSLVPFLVACSWEFGWLVGWQTSDQIRFCLSTYQLSHPSSSRALLRNRYRAFPFDRLVALGAIRVARFERPSVNRSG